MGVTLRLDDHLQPGATRRVPERPWYLAQPSPPGHQRGQIHHAPLGQADRPRVGLVHPPHHGDRQPRLFARKRRTDPLDQLSGREREVLALVAEGLSNRGIAARLFVTERTVEAHVKQIFLKLGLATDLGSHGRVLALLAYLRRPG